MVMSVKLSWLRLVEQTCPVISPKVATKTKTQDFYSGQDD